MRANTKRITVLLAALMLALQACGSEPGATATTAEEPAATTATAGESEATTTTAGGDDGSVLEGKELVFINAGNTSEYQIAAGEWFKRYAEEAGASATIVDGQFDAAAQVAAMDSAIAAGVDALIIQPIDAVAITPSTIEARNAGIVVGIVGGLPDPGAVVPAVGIFNDEELVREAAREAVAWLQAQHPGEAAKLVLFDIPSIIVCHDWRMVPFRDEVVAQLGAENVEEVYFDLVDHTLDVVVNRMTDLVQSGAEFNIFSACGGTGAVGGLDVLVENGMATATDGVPNDIWALSIDATPAELAYLVDPNVGLAITIALTPKENAQVHLDTLEQILAGDIDPDSDYVALAPGLLLTADSGCEAIRDALADQYSVLPGYQQLDC